MMKMNDTSTRVKEIEKETTLVIPESITKTTSQNVTHPKHRYQTQYSLKRQTKNELNAIIDN